MKIPERERSGIYMTAIRLEVQRQNLRISTRKERVDSKPKDVDNSGDSKKNGGKSSAKSIWKNFLQKVEAVWDFGQKKFAGKSTTEKYVITGGCVALVILIFSLIVLLIRRRR